MLSNCSVANVSIAEMNAMVESQKYADARAALRQSKLSDAERLDWLRAKAEEGHVPLQYDLARRLFPIDLTESLKWYARGRLARTLDVAECGDATVSLRLRTGLDQISEEIVKAGQANPKLFNAAILDAVQWDERRTKVPSSKWICGESKPPSPEGYVLPAEQRKQKRNEARITMAGKAKLEAARETAFEAAQRANYSVVDSRFPSAGGRWTSESNIYWLDNERVIFLGNDVTRIARNPDSGQAESRLNGLFVWDTTTGQVRQLYRADSVESLCVFRGFISLRARWDNDTAHMVEGAIDRLDKRPDDERRYPRVDRWPHCGGWPPAPAHVYWGNFVPLLPEHGYLTRSQEGYRLYPPGNKAGVPVSFPNLGAGVRYDERKGAYVVSGSYRGLDRISDTSYGNFPLLADRFFYWLYPNGRVEKVVQPFGACTAGGGGGYLTPRGFLQRNGCLIKKDGGEEWIGSSVLSPDGCKVATTGAPGSWPSEALAKASEAERVAGRPGLVTVKVIDICKGRQ